MEKQLVIDIPARTVQAEVKNVLDNDRVQVSYVIYFNEEVNIVVKETVPKERLRFE